MINEEKLDAFRPLPFYFITDSSEKALEYDKILNSLKALKADGYGGVVVFNKPPMGFSKEEFLSDRWFETVEKFIKAGLQLKLRIFINDDFNFPPGDVAGKLYKIAPELYQQRILIKDGKVCTEPVSWGFPAFENPKSSELFIKLVYEEYEKRLSHYFGKGLEGFFSDADNRRVSAESYSKDSKQRNLYPWSDNFAESFKNTFNYDITPYLFDIASGKCIPQTIDYWDHCSALYQKWFENNYKWCKDHGLKYTFHTSDTAPYSRFDAERSSSFSEGRASDLTKNCDFPGTDQELRALNGGTHMRHQEIYEAKATYGGDNSLCRTPDFYSVFADLRAKQAGSSAIIHHKKCGMCEMFAASNFGVTADELRNIASWQIMQGIGFVVVHAYHHRFFGETKYFAPPDFSRKGLLTNGLKKLNDTIAEYSCLCSEGTPLCDVAVLDMTEYVWGGGRDNKKLFDVCEELNRRIQGYAITDIKGIAQNPGMFKVAVNPGIDIKPDEAELLSSLGITLINSNELCCLDTLAPQNFTCFGDGTPHFIRRMTDNDEMLVIANIENDIPITQTVTYGEKKYEMLLYPGEMAFISNGYVNIPSHPKTMQNGLLPKKLKVCWHKPNYLPLRTFKSSNDAKSITFKTKTPLQGLKLFVSKRNLKNTEYILFDGIKIEKYSEINVFDDEYASFELPLLKAGEHTISIKDNKPYFKEDETFIEGEFDLQVNTKGDYNSVYFVQYNLTHYIPAECEIILDERRCELYTDISWADQGHPFYSGEVSYIIPADAVSAGSEYIIAKTCGNPCRIDTNDSIGEYEPFSPAILKLPESFNEIHITVSNTLANRMECYRAPSGLTSESYFAVSKKM